jgi:hypothetical protein
MLVFGQFIIYRMANFGARIVVGNILEMDDFE